MIQSSFAEIARLLSEFFLDLDVVPTDVLVGLLLLRQRQQLLIQNIVSQVRMLA
jgi:sn1-specific diacylglycerol lipase